MTATYPPDRHLLRDLPLEFDHSDRTSSKAWLPVVTADVAVRDHDVDRVTALAVVTARKPA